MRVEGGPGFCLIARFCQSLGEEMLVGGELFLLKGVGGVVGVDVVGLVGGLDVVWLGSTCR